MAILKIAKLGNPILFKKAEKVHNIGDLSIKELIHNMSETMLDAEGIGLAAPQVHVSKQIIIFRIFEENEEDNSQIKITALINPKIEYLTKEKENQWEGCLSIPGMLGLVERNKQIIYEGFDMDGNLIRKKAEGIQARVVQHEYDHLQGILYNQKLINSSAYGFAEEIERYWKQNEKKT